MKSVEIIKLPSVIKKERKQQRSKNLKNNKNAYKKLLEMMVPCELKLSQFRKYYHPVLSTEEKEIVIIMGLDPWSIAGLKYIGDCRRLNIRLGCPVPKNSGDI